MCSRFKPRTITQDEINFLGRFSKIVMDQMELRFAARKIDDLNRNLEKSKNELYIKATHDHLTEICNRRALIEILEKTSHLAHREKNQ